MDRVIKIEIKNLYGKNHYYALTYAKELETLTGTKTLSYRHIEALKSLGFTFEQVTDKL